MLRADSAQVSWDPKKKEWHVRIQIGAEVIRRPAPKASPDADDETLRSVAVETAKDDGYEVDPSRVAITR